MNRKAFENISRNADQVLLLILVCTSLVLASIEYGIYVTANAALMFASIYVFTLNIIKIYNWGKCYLIEKEIIFTKKQMVLLCLCVTALLVADIFFLDQFYQDLLLKIMAIVIVVGLIFEFIFIFRK